MLFNFFFQFLGFSILFVLLHVTTNAFSEHSNNFSKKKAHSIVVDVYNDAIWLDNDKQAIIVEKQKNNNNIIMSELGPNKKLEENIKSEIADSKNGKSSWNKRPYQHQHSTYNNNNNKAFDFDNLSEQKHHQQQQMSSYYLQDDELHNLDINENHHNKGQQQKYQDNGNTNNNYNNNKFNRNHANHDDISYLWKQQYIYTNNNNNNNNHQLNYQNNNKNSNNNNSNSNEWLFKTSIPLFSENSQQGLKTAANATLAKIKITQQQQKQQQQVRNENYNNNDIRLQLSNRLTNINTKNGYTDNFEAVNDEFHSHNNNNNYNNKSNKNVHQIKRYV